MAKFGMVPLQSKSGAMFSKKGDNKRRTKIKKKVYEREIDKLQQELIKVQIWA